MDPHVHEEGQHLDVYGDPEITSGHAPIPNWLILTYITLPIWGLITLYVFWGGSHGWLDRGYWHELQKAANTTVIRFTEPVYNPLE